VTPSVSRKTTPGTPCPRPCVVSVSFARLRAAAMLVPPLGAYCDTTSSAAVRFVLSPISRVASPENVIMDSRASVSARANASTRDSPNALISSVTGIIDPLWSSTSTRSKTTVHVGTLGGSGGGGGGAVRTPQSAQSVPHGQPLYSEPRPPSSHSPSDPHDGSVGQSLLQSCPAEEVRRARPSSKRSRQPVIMRRPSCLRAPRS